MTTNAASTRCSRVPKISPQFSQRRAVVPSTEIETRRDVAAAGADASLVDTGAVSTDRWTTTTCQASRCRPTTRGNRHGEVNSRHGDASLVGIEAGDAVQLRFVGRFGVRRRCVGGRCSTSRTARNDSPSRRPPKDNIDQRRDRVAPSPMRHWSSSAP